MFSSRTDWSLTPNRLSEQLRARRERGLPILDLTESNPTRCGFSFDPRLCPRCPQDYGPVPGGAWFCPYHGCSVFFYPPLDPEARGGPAHAPRP